MVYRQFKKSLKVPYADDYFYQGNLNPKTNEPRLKEALEE